MTCTTIQTRPDPTIYVPDDLGEWFPHIGAYIGDWRTFLEDFVFARDGWCWVTGCDGSNMAYMHEAIRRSAVMGWPRPWRVLIQTPYNCTMLCHLHHGTHREPALKEIADWMYDTYGTDYLLWIKSLPFKVESAHPLVGWMRRHTWNHSS